MRAYNNDLIETALKRYGFEIDTRLKIKINGKYLVYHRLYDKFRISHSYDNGYELVVDEHPEYKLDLLKILFSGDDIEVELLEEPFHLTASIMASRHRKLRPSSNGSYELPTDFFQKNCCLDLIEEREDY